MKFNAVLPEFLVSDMVASLRFYTEVLGFRSEYSRDQGRFQFLSRGEAQLMLFESADTEQPDKDRWITGTLETPRGRGVNLQIDVEDLAGLFDAVIQARWPVYSSPATQERTVGRASVVETEFLIQDPDGYLLRFSQETGPRRVPAPEWSVEGLDHVQIAIPVGGEAAARAFYVVRLGLTEIPKPDNLAKKGGLWLSLGDRQLHLGVQSDFVPARKAHSALVVRGLAALRGDLEAAGVPTVDDDPLPGARRFYVSDPFGNRLEFLEWD